VGDGSGGRRWVNKDNFWPWARSVPAARCSEIHYHQGDDVPCPEVVAGRACLGPACDCDPLESRSGTWSVMQFEQLPDRTRRPLPSLPSTPGMGLERLCAVLGGFRFQLRDGFASAPDCRSREADGKDLRAVGLHHRLGCGSHARHRGPQRARGRVPDRRRRSSQKRPVANTFCVGRA